MRVGNFARLWFIAFFAVFFPLGAQAHFIPKAVLTPSNLDFPDTRVGEVASPQAITVSKTRSFLPLNIYSVTLSNFDAFDIVSDGCSGKTLFGSQTCQIQIGFSPDQVGHYSSSVVMIDSGRDIVNVAPLTGEGVEPQVSLSATSLNFGEQTVGKSSTQTVTVTNTGTADLNISSLSVTGGDFSQTNDCVSAPVTPGDSCNIDVIFTPSIEGSITGSLSINDDASDSPQTVSLQGTGKAGPIADVVLVPTSLNFSGQQVGITSAPQTVTMVNIGGIPLVVTSISVTGEFVIVASTNTCLSAAVAPDGGTCTFQATFSPTSAGTKNGSISIDDNAGDTPQTIPVTGIGVIPDTPNSSLSANSLNFGNVNLGETSAPQSVTVTNTGTSDLEVASAILGGTDPHNFSSLENCTGITLGINQSCTITVTFTPNEDETLTATITLTSNAGDSPQTIILTGVGIGGGNIGGGGGCALSSRNFQGMKWVWLGFLMPLSAGLLSILSRKRSVF